MLLTKSEFEEWKQSEVTKAFFQAADFRIQETKDILGNSAGLDSTADNFYRGFIQAYMEMEEFRVDDLQEENE